MLQLSLMKRITRLTGRGARFLTRVKGSGGSALPGLVVEKLEPNFLSETLEKLPFGVVIVSGTNGKTTTTKIITDLLTASKLKVFTNPTGSNFTRGIASAVFAEIEKAKKFDFDIAVLELDEAHAVHFAQQIKPRHALLTNVLADQLDRFGKPEKVAELLEKVAVAATDGVVLNRDNQLVANIASSVTTPVKFFGHSPKLAGQFPLDDAKGKPPHQADVELTSLDDRDAKYRIDGKNHQVSLRLSGSHNALNAASALCLTRMILGDDADNKKLLLALSKVQPAFGRGETVKINGVDLDMILVKNPSGFCLSLTSQYDESADVMIAINNNFGDGVDPSWLECVDLSRFRHIAVISGMCTDTVASCLKNNRVEFDLIEPNLKKALRALLESPRKKQIFCNYTAMLTLRKHLSALVDMENVL